MWFAPMCQIPDQSTSNRCWKSATAGDSIVLLGGFNAHVGNDSKIWMGLIGRNGLPALNLSGVQLSDLSASNSVCRTNTMISHMSVHKCTRHLDTLG